MTRDNFESAATAANKLSERAVILRENLLAKNASFISSADALLRVSVSRERQRVASAVESVDRIREAFDERSITGVLGSAGRLLNQVSRTLGLGPKAVGPISELPFEQKVSQNLELRFVQTKADHKLNRNRAISRVPDSGRLSSIGIDADSLSLLPGQITPDVDRLKNRFGPGSVGTPRKYSESDGRAAARQFADKVFPFKITNYARQGLPNTQAENAGRATPSDVYPATERFLAYIGTLSEQFNVSWDEKGYLGRAEGTYMYQGAGRSFNMDIIMFATNDGDPIPDIVTRSEDGTTVSLDGYPIAVADLVQPSSLIPNILSAAPALMDNSISKTDLWRKISFLESMCYPQYDEAGTYARAPFGRITVGSLWENQLMIIDSLNIVYDPLVWDLNGKHYTPMFVNIAIAGKLLHDSSPGTLSSGQFGYYDSTGKVNFLHRSNFK